MLHKLFESFTECCFTLGSIVIRQLLLSLLKQFHLKCIHLCAENSDINFPGIKIITKQFLK